MSTNDLSDRTAIELKLKKKDVKTPFEFHHLTDHVLKDVANCRETRFGEAAGSFKQADGEAELRRTSIGVAARDGTLPQLKFTNLHIRSQNH
ncbi:MAG: hypothetical protein JNL64_10160 [Blastocatellia bacterium]|nr:hypothetical protein [Blastocatellia bacterium]